jgi:hypothetical protein
MFWFDIEGQVQYVGTKTQGTLLFYEWNHNAHGHVMLVSLWFVNEKQACVYEHRVEGYLFYWQVKLNLWERNKKS